MTINPKCCICGEELNEPGGLLFSPPVDGVDIVTKDHLCMDCYNNVKDYTIT